VKREALAAEVWRRLFDFIIDTASERNRVLGRHELSPNDSRALFALDARAGRSMGSLAEEWGCDASYATSLIDRLETRGLVTRESATDDRRVKLARLTSAGASLRTTLARELYRPPASLEELSVADLRALWLAVDKLPAPRRR
jgi:DNA-binding MarR family transcriptional regulator